jgi:hypothetical protein
MTAAFEPGVSWLAIEPGSRPTSFQAMSLLAGVPVVLAVFETDPESGDLLEYGRIATDRATDHGAVQDWLTRQADRLKLLTAQRQP